MSKSRNWCFTLNNPERVDDLGVLFPANVKYAVWQLEAGANGTRHIQGYIELGTCRGLSYVRNLINGAHWEIRRGTDVQAREYCMKEESRIAGPWEHGVFVVGRQGMRNDLEEIKEMLDLGKSMIDIYESHFATSARYYKFFDRYNFEKMQHRRDAPEVYLFIGESGTGKSRFCSEYVNGEQQYWKPRGPWWDGYTGQPVCILDEFYGWLAYDTILRLTDRYPYTVEVKGGHRKFTSTVIFITSNRPPWSWWEKPKRQDAFSRRIKGITHFSFGTDGVVSKTEFSSIEEYKTVALLMNYFNK